MKSNDMAKLTKFLSSIGREYSPRIFLPFLPIVVAAIIIDVLTFGVGLLFTSFIWCMLDMELYQFLRHGKTGFRSFYNIRVPFGRIFLSCMLRRIILILAYLCLIFPGVYLSAKLSGLGNTIITHPDEKNAFNLLRITFQGSDSYSKDIILITLNSFYIIILTILTFGIISPWSVPYYRSIKISRYIVHKNLEFASSLISEVTEYDEPPELPTINATSQDIDYNTTQEGIG